MPTRRDTSICLDGLTAIDARAGTSYDLGRLEGVHVLVVLRHRH